MIARNARMLLKHVNDLLDLSKLEAGKLKIELQDTDVSRAACACSPRTSWYSRPIAASTTTIDADDAGVTAVDAEKLQRVLMNLLGKRVQVRAGRRRACAACFGAPRRDAHAGGRGFRSRA